MKSKIIENVKVVDIADKGNAIGKHEDLVILINRAVPGDIVDVEVKKKRKSMWVGRVVNTRERSQERTDPFCEHFEFCGGCKWQDLQYSSQLHYKQKRVEDAMRKLASIDYCETNAIMGAPDISHYRNKLEFSFSNKRWLTPQELDNKEIIAGDAVGFHVPGRFDKVLDITKCHLQDELNNEIRNFVREFAFENKLSFYDLREQHGLLRNLLIRNNQKNEWMMVMIFGENNPEEMFPLLDAIKENFKNIVSLQYVINTKANDTIYDLDIHCYHGEDHIVEKLEDIEYRIGAKTFFQTNTKQTLNLYSTAREWAALKKSDVVYDLYTGTGSIALFVAHQCDRIIGVDSVPEAIEHAKGNADRNGINNATFLAGDMKFVFTDEFFSEHGKPDVIITDPPRAGMHEKVVEQINKSGASRVVYISCNPGTQARDLKLMADHYLVEKIQPVDMFPHTDHVENIVSLKLKA